MKKPKFFCCPTFSIKSNLCKGKMYVLDGNGVKCECVITDEGNNILEIKNTEVRKDAVVGGETAGLEKRGGFQNRHVFRSHFGGVDHRLQCVLRTGDVDTLLPVQHAALAGDAAETPFFPADGQVVILNRFYRETVLPQPNGGFFKETKLRGFVLIVHCEVLLVSKKIGRSILKMLRPVDGLSCEMKKGAYLMASTKPTNRRLKDRMKF